MCIYSVSTGIARYQSYCTLPRPEEIDSGNYSAAFQFQQVSSEPQEKFHRNRIPGPSGREKSFWHGYLEESCKQISWSSLEKPSQSFFPATCFNDLTVENRSSIDTTYFENETFIAQLSKQGFMAYMIFASDANSCSSFFSNGRQRLLRPLSVIPGGLSPSACFHPFQTEYAIFICEIFPELLKFIWNVNYIISCILFILCWCIGICSLFEVQMNCKTILE